MPLRREHPHERQFAVFASVWLLFTSVFFEQPVKPLRGGTGVIASLVMTGGTANRPQKMCGKAAVILSIIGGLWKACRSCGCCFGLCDTSSLDRSGRGYVVPSEAVGGPFDGNVPRPLLGGASSRLAPSMRDWRICRIHRFVQKSPRHWREPERSPREGFLF